MLITVTGTYANGAIQLDEPVPEPNETVMPVLVTFLSAPMPASASSPKRFYFDEALALSADSSVTVSDAVIEERREAE